MRRRAAEGETPEEVCHGDTEAGDAQGETPEEVACCDAQGETPGDAQGEAPGDAQGETPGDAQGEAPEEVAFGLMKKTWRWIQTFRNPSDGPSREAPIGVVGDAEACCDAQGETP